MATETLGTGVSVGVEAVGVAHVNGGATDIGEQRLAMVEEREEKKERRERAIGRKREKGKESYELATWRVLVGEELRKEKKKK